MTRVVWELNGEVRGERALPLGARLDVGGGGAEWALLPDPGGWLVVAHRLGGVVVEAAEGVRRGDVWVRRGEELADGTALSLGAHTLRLSVGPGQRAPLPTVPGYALTGLLGSGGSGQVYAATCAQSGARVALKVLKADADPLTAQRFRREVALAQGLHVRGVAKVLGVLEARGLVVLVRELIEGPSLAECLARAQLPVEQVLEIGVAIGEALGGVHSAGIVHRDVKPENLILGAAGPVLIDFDLARRFAAEQNLRSLTRLTQSGAGLGSLAYLPPEQLRAAHQADARADVYGLGATVYHALCGRAPFAEVEPEAFLDALAGGPPPLQGPGFPPGLSAIVARATAPDPATRYANGAEFATALRAAQGWQRTAEEWVLSLEEVPSGELDPEVGLALQAFAGHVRIDLSELDPDGSETARLVTFLRSVARVARPPVVLAHAPQATAHTLYKVGLAPKFALDEPRAGQPYAG